MLGTDSLEYDILERAVEAVKDLDPEAMSCEIGLRAGGGSKFMIDTLCRTNQRRTHIAIDPYGNIDYETSEGHVTHHDYTNTMRNICMKELHQYISEVYNSEINFLAFILEDTEFFNRYADGVPVYSNYKTLLTKYACIHFDGPHAIAPLRAEVDFFAPRMITGATAVFDDIGNYDHLLFERELFSKGFALIERGHRKASYVYTI